jgi:hypothetical protein
MRSSGRHSNETTKSKERKDGDAARRERAGQTEREKVRLWKGKKRRRKRVEMQTDGVLGDRESPASRLRESYQRSYQEPRLPSLLLPNPVPFHLHPRVAPGAGRA